MARAPEWRRRPNPRSAAASSIRSRRRVARRPSGGAALGDNCHAISRPPFVLAGDLSDEQLARWNHDTVAPAARAMKNCYFRVAPTAPITVLLFGNEASYNDQAARLFNERDISVYGYYKPERRTLVLNIATGGGTLVHELTHSLIDFDFPKAPTGSTKGWPRSMSNAAFATATMGRGSRASRIGGCAACNRRFASSGCARSNR